MDGDPRWFGSLDRAWTHVLESLPPIASPRTLLFSGGVDSGLLAWELRDRGDLGLCTVGVAGSPDLAAAETAAERLHLSWAPTHVTPEQVRAAARGIADELDPSTPTSNRVQVAMALALSAAPAGPVLCGQGADELFLGYAHFVGLAPDVLASRADGDYARLVRSDWPRTQRIATRLGRTLVAPYLAPEFERAVRAIPIEARAPRPVPKALFRAWARHRGLPEEIAMRRKRAFQFGSGVDRVLARDGTSAATSAAVW